MTTPGEAGPAGAGHAPRRAGGLLRERSFRLLWTGETVSGTGTAMALVGVPLLAAQVLHASVFALSALTAAGYVPWLIIGLPAGAWVDRLPPRTLMITCDVISALLFASLPVAAWLGVLGIAQVLVVALLAGAANVLFSTAYQVYLPSLVGPAELLEGNAKLQGSAQVASISGRGLAGLAAQAAGYAGALLVNAGSFLASAACLVALRGQERQERQDEPPGPVSPGSVSPGPVSPPSAPPGSSGGVPARPPGPGLAGSAPSPVPAPGATRRPGSVRAEIADGLRLIAGDRLLRRLTVYPALANLAYAGAGSLQVAFLLRVVGVSAVSTGLLMAAGSAGGVGGAIAARPAARRLGTARALLAANAGVPLLGLMIPLASRGAGLAWYVGGLAALSAGGVAGNIVLLTFRQGYVPAAMLGRVIASQRFIAFGAVPVGALTAGGLGAELGVRAALWILLGGYALSGTLLLTRPVLAGRDLPASPAAPAGTPAPA